MQAQTAQESSEAADLLTEVKARFHPLSIEGQSFYLHKTTNSLISGSNALGKAISALLESDSSFTVSEPEFVELFRQTSLLLKTAPPSESGVYDITDLSISPTLNCNLNCTYCYNYIEGDKAVIRKLPALDKAGVRRILETVARLPLAKALRVCFIGGEPFLDPKRLRHLIRICEKYCRRTKRKAYYFVTTNGINLALPAVRRLIEDFQINVSVSFDGPKDWHNETRKLLNGKGSFDTLKTAVDNFLEYYPPTIRSARATIRLEPGRLVETYRFLVDWGFNDISLGSADFAMPDPAGIVSSNLPGAIDELGTLKRYVVEDFLAGRLKRHSWYTEIFTNLYYGIYKNRVCGATKNHLAFDVYGKMQPCHRFLGNTEFALQPEDIIDWGASILVKQIVHFGETTDCNKCWARGLCGGECYHVGRDISRQTDHIKKQRQICNFKRRQYQLGIEAYVEICQRDMRLMSRLVEREEDVFGPTRSLSEDSRHSSHTSLD